MKKNSISLASRLVVLALACVATMCLTACSSDDDSSKKSVLVGLWVTDDDKPERSINFKADGTGEWKNLSENVWAAFTYSILGNPNMPVSEVYFKWAYSNEYTVWRYENSGSYRVDGDMLYLTIDGTHYTYKRKY